MLSRIMLVAGAFGLLCSAALAQPAAPLAGPTMSNHPADAFKHYSAAELAGMVNKPDVGPILGLISDHENWLSEMIARNGTGQVEIHDHFIDIMSVLSGNATITYGGTVTGNKETAPGEWRGGTIAGGTSVDVHAGDYIQIPAGTPHLTSVAAGTNFKVLTIKVRQ